MKLICFILSFGLSIAGWCSHSPIAKLYIERHQDIAIAEMYRTGIPASIKLAQGLLESDWGRSDLATVANNHFGIKCGSRWEGKKFYKEDDDHDADGNLIKSCFRAFDSEQESYIAHSEFLTDPAKSYRYGFLFDLSSDDYRSWAQGLYDAGYATDKSYPDKLISVIRKYELHRFDVATVQSTRPATAEAQAPDAQPIAIYQPKEKQSADPIKNESGLIRYPIAAINGVPVVYTDREMSLEELSSWVGIGADNLLMYNDGVKNTRQQLSQNFPVYLHSKKRSYKGDVLYHEVKEGETIEDISQLYGITAQSLKAKNKIHKNAAILVGEKVWLDGIPKDEPRPRFERHDQRVIGEFLEPMESKAFKK